MKQKILKKIAVISIIIAISIQTVVLNVVQVRANIFNDIFYETVGGDDAEWWKVFSDIYTLKGNFDVTYVFENKSFGQDVWDNYCMVFANEDFANQHGNSSEYQEWATVRADGYGWGYVIDRGIELETPDGNPINITTSYFPPSYYDDFMYIMRNARVTLHANRKGDLITVTSEAVSRYDSSKRFHMDVDFIATTDNVYLFFTAEQSNLRFLQIPNVSHHKVGPLDSENTYKGESTGTSGNNKISVGNSVAFDIPKEVPMLGGKKIELDVSGIPVSFVREGNNFKLGIGIENICSLKQEGWWTFKKFVETQKASYKQSINGLIAARYGIAYTGLSVKPEIKLYGYIEGTLDGNKVLSQSSNAVLTIKGKGSASWQLVTPVIPIPIVIKVSGEIGVDAKMPLSLTLAGSGSQVFLDGEYTLTLPKIRGSVGPGCTFANASVYGEGKNEVTISRKDGVKAKLTGEIGFSWEVACFSHSYPIVKSKEEGWEYYNSKKKKNSIKKIQLPKADDIKDQINEFEIDDTKATRFNGKCNITTAEDEADWILQSDIYRAANPKLIKTSNGTVVLTYIGAVTGRSKGNQYAAVYSVYDQNTKKWCSPKIIDDDKTADFDVNFYEKNNKIYFIWTNIKNHIDAEKMTDDNQQNMEDIAKLTEIKMAVYDIEADKMSSVELTDNASMEYKPSIYVDDEETVYVAWNENSNNDMISLNGNNIVHIGRLKDNKYEEDVKKIYTRPISALKLGKFQDQIMAVYMTEDGTDKADIIALNLSGSEKKINNSTENVSNISIGKINGLEAIMWMQGGECAGLNCFTSEMNEPAVLIPDDGIVNENYFLYNDDNDTRIFCVSGAGDEKSGIYMYDIGHKKETTSALLHSLQGNIGNIGVVKQNDSFMFLFTNSDINILDDNMEISTDLCFMIDKAKSNLQIESVDFTEEELVSQKMTFVNVNLKNNGMYESGKNDYIEVLVDENVIGHKDIDVLEDGGETNVEVPVSCSSPIAKESQIEVRLVEDGKIVGFQKDIIGKADLAVCAEKNDGRVFVTLKNDSKYDTGAELLVYDTDETGKLLDSKDLGVISAGEDQEEQFDCTKYDGIESLMFIVKSNSSELYESNNQCSVYIGSETLKTLDHIEAEKQKTQYKTGETISLDDLSVKAYYSDFSEKSIENYSTNLDQIDMNTEGEKILKITYEEVGLESTVEIPITVIADENANTNILPESLNLFYKIRTGNKIPNMKVGESISLSGQSKVLPENAADSLVSYTTANRLIAGFRDGRLYASSPGTVMITGETANGIKDFVYLTVESNITDQKSTADTVKNTTTDTAKKTTTNTVKKTTQQKVIKKPQKVSGLDVYKKGKNKIYAYWNEDNVTGYQVQYALNKKFTKKSKTKNAKKCSIKLKKLTKKKKYYIRVRAYNQLNGKVKYGKWSKVKSMKL